MPLTDPMAQPNTGLGQLQPGPQNPGQSVSMPPPNGAPSGSPGNSGASPQGPSVPGTDPQAGLLAQTATQQQPPTPQKVTVDITLRDGSTRTVDFDGAPTPQDVDFVATQLESKGTPSSSYGPMLPSISKFMGGTPNITVTPQRASELTQQANNWLQSNPELKQLISHTLAKGLTDNKATGDYFGNVAGVANYAASQKNSAAESAQAHGEGGAPINFAHQQDVPKMNKGLLVDLGTVASQLGMKLGIGTAITGHSQMTTSGNISRHTKGDAVDVSTINGVSYNSNPHQFSLLAKQLQDALATHGYRVNSESGNQASVLFGFNDPKRGGNHLNHVHISNTGDPMIGNIRAQGPVQNGKQPPLITDPGYNAAYSAQDQSNSQAHGEYSPPADQAATEHLLSKGFALANTYRNAVLNGDTKTADASGQALRELPADVRHKAITARNYDELGIGQLDPSDNTAETSRAALAAKGKEAANTGGGNISKWIGNEIQAGVERNPMLGGDVFQPEKGLLGGTPAGKQVSKNISGLINPLSVAGSMGQMATQPLQTLENTVGAIHNIVGSTDLDGKPVKAEDRIDGLFALGTTALMAMHPAMKLWATGEKAAAAMEIAGKSSMNPVQAYKVLNVIDAATKGSMDLSQIPRTSRTDPKSFTERMYALGAAGPGIDFTGDPQADHRQYLDARGSRAKPVQGLYQKGNFDPSVSTKTPEPTYIRPMSAKLRSAIDDAVIQIPTNDLANLKLRQVRPRIGPRELQGPPEVQGAPELQGPPDPNNTGTQVPERTKPIVDSYIENRGPRTYGQVEGGSGVQEPSSGASWAMNPDKTPGLPNGVPPIDPLDEYWGRATGQGLRGDRSPAPGVAYFVRHGDTALNAGHGTAVDVIRGHKDIPLSDVGRQQGEQAATDLAGANLSHVMASDLSRASDTGDMISNYHNTGTENTNNLRPWNLGEFQGQPSAEVAPKIQHYIDNPDENIPGGESFNDFRGRFSKAMETVIQRTKKGENVAVATHYRNLQLVKAFVEAGGDWSKIKSSDLFAKDDSTPPGSIHVLRADRDGWKLQPLSEYQKGETAPVRANRGPQEPNLVSPDARNQWTTEHGLETDKLGTGQNPMPGHSRLQELTNSVDFANEYPKGLSNNPPAETAAREPGTGALADQQFSDKVAEQHPNKTVTFTTEKGSTYKVNQDGTTTRNKAPRPEHPGDFGPQPQSEHTVYVDKDGLNKLGLMQAVGTGKRFVTLSDGSVGIMYTDGQNAGKIERSSVVMPEVAPKQGLYPVESFDGGTRVHFGNKITGVGGELNLKEGKAGTPEGVKPEPTPKIETTVANHQFNYGKQPGEIDATKQDGIKEGDQPEHQNGDKGREAAEAGGSNSTVSEPKSQGPEEATEATGLARRFEDAERWANGKSPTPPEGITLKELDEHGRFLIDSGKVKPLEVIRENRPLTPGETAAVTHFKRGLMNEVDQIHTALKDVVDPTKAVAYSDRLGEIDKTLDQISDAAQRTRGYWHQGGMALQLAYEPDYSIADLRRRAESLNGGDLNPQQTHAIESHANGIQELKTDLNETKKGIDKAVEAIPLATDIKRSVDKLVSLIKQGKAQEPLSPDTFSSGGIKKVRGKDTGGVFIGDKARDAQVQQAIRDLAVKYRQAGAKSMSDVLQEFGKDLPFLTHDEIYDAIDGKYSAQRKALTAAQEAARDTLNDIKRAADTRRKSGAQKFLAGVNNVLDSFRTLKLIGHATAPGIQGRPSFFMGNALKNPGIGGFLPSLGSKEWAESYKPMIKGYAGARENLAGPNPTLGFSGGVPAEQAQLAAWKNDSALWNDMKKSGMSQVLAMPHGSLFQVEEENLGRGLVKKIPGVGAAVDRSSAAFSGYMNNLRVEMFKSTRELSAKMGLSGSQRDLFLKDMANMIATTTGRSMSPFAKALAQTSHIEFAPRYLASKWEYATLKPLREATSPQARQVISKMYVSHALGTAVMAGTLTAGLRALGHAAYFDINPRSTLFGSLVVGNKSWDLIGGTSEPMKFVMQFFGKILSNGNDQQASPQNATQHLGEYLEDKLTPAIRAGIDLGTGQRQEGSGKYSRPAIHIGQKDAAYFKKPKFSWGQEAAEAGEPIMIQGIVDAHSQHQPITPALTGGSIGFPMRTVPKKSPKGVPAKRSNLLGGAVKY